MADGNRWGKRWQRRHGKQLHSLVVVRCCTLLSPSLLCQRLTLRLKTWSLYTHWQRRSLTAAITRQKNARHSGPKPDSSFKISLALCDILGSQARMGRTAYKSRNCRCCLRGRNVSFRFPNSTILLAASSAPMVWLSLTPHPHLGQHSSQTIPARLLRPHRCACRRGAHGDYGRSIWELPQNSGRLQLPRRTPG